MPVFLAIQLGLIMGMTPAFSGQPIGQIPEVFDAWVSFSDKGLRSEGEIRSALRELEAGYDPRALARRRLRRTRPGLFDAHDLPLSSAYLRQVAETGARVRVKSRWFNGITVLATEGQLAAIKNLPFVQEVTDVHRHKAGGNGGGRVPNDPDLRRAPPRGFDEDYGWSGPQLRQLGLAPVHQAGFRGTGVRIAIIDTGFLLQHPAFQNSSGPLDVVGQWDFMDNDSVVSPEPGDRVDQHEHGTLVLGAIAANLRGELVGSAPEAEFILLKAEDAETEYFLEERWFAAALEYAEAHGADVVSSSLVLYQGYEPSDVDGHTSVMARAWDLAVGNGMIGLQGGGNSGHDEDPTTHNLLPPAGAPGVMAVGAVDPEGKIARFSSDGLRINGEVKPGLLALGLGTATVSPYVPGAYSASGGTSMATPLLAGAVACLLQAHPDWSVSEVKSALERSGSYFQTHGHPDPLFIQGFGIPDLEQALRDPGSQGAGGD